MKNKKGFFFGLLILAFLVISFFVGLSEKFFSASLFTHTQQTSSEQVFIPNDFIANPGENGEIVVRAGDDFPLFARDDLMGIYFDFSWPKEKVEFLGAVLDETIFENTDFDITVTNDPMSNTAQVAVWTGGATGLSVPTDGDLLNIMFSIRENTELGDEIPITLSNVEIVYDSAILQSYTLSSIQSGIIRVGDPKNPNLQQQFTGEFYFEDDILAKPGEERVILLRSGTQQDIAGFMFDLEYPESKMDFLGYETVGTPLEDAGFAFITEDSLQNHIGILGATGSLDGVNLDFSDPLLALRFLVHDNVPFGESIPLSIRKMDTVNTFTLGLVPVNVDSGTILTSPVSSLRLIDSIPLSSSSIRLIFSDNIIAADLTDITFTPRLKNSSTEFEVDGNSIIIRNLTTMIPDELYSVELQEHITGNIAGTLSPDHNYMFFQGFPLQYPISRFQIQNVQATSDTSVVIGFTEPVNPESIEAEDFHIEGLTVLAANQSGGKNVTLHTSSQAILGGSSWLTINKASNIHDPKSTAGELLSLNIARFTPFGYNSDGPVIDNISARKPDVVEVTFDTPVLGSSIVLDAFSITEQGRSQNLITSETFFEISPDHTSIIFHNVRTVAGRNYVMTIRPGSIKSNRDGNAAISLIGNIESFIGQGSFFTPWDFGLESAEATSPDTVVLTFSEEIEAKTFSPLQFQIWTKDTAELPRKLKIISAEGKGNSITLVTQVQKQKQSYSAVVLPESVRSAYGETLGIPNSRGFVGYSQEQMRAVSLSPKEVQIGEKTQVTIIGVHFPENSIVRIGNQTLPTTFISDTQLNIETPEDLKMDSYDIVVVSPAGDESRLPNAVTVINSEIEAQMAPLVLSEESYAMPYRVPNDGVTSSTLWVRIKDPRGVSDIEKVTADLRGIGGPAAVSLSLHHLEETSTSDPDRWDEGGAIIKKVNDMAFIDGMAWYKREITVPSTIPTSKEATEIPITVENKTGRTGTGVVTLLVNRDLESSLPPVIENATAAPDQVSPGDETEVTFQVEISDEDGGINVSRVVLDASQVGLGIIVLQPLDEIQEDRECSRNDYVIEPWTDCVLGVQMRSVELKPGIECLEVGKKPEERRDCTGGECSTADWEQDEEWGECYLYRQEKQWHKKPTSTCVGEANKPNSQWRDCNIYLQNTDGQALMRALDFLIPKAHAVTIFGNKIWYQSDPYKIPNWVPEGVYTLPLTAIDREGTEAVGEITLRIARDSTGSPQINENDIFVSPKHSIPNDNKTEFQVFAKATDPNGHEDIVSVSVNLAPIGLPPLEMTKGQIEGTGAWYATEKLTIPRSVIPGFRTLTVSATDIDGNVTETGFRFHVSTPDTSGDSPTIPADRSYTNPRTFLNDQDARGTLYVFVEEGDAPITHVTANLGTILRHITPEENNRLIKEKIITDIKQEEDAEKKKKEELLQEQLNTTDGGKKIPAPQASLFPTARAEEIIDDGCYWINNERVCIQKDFTIADGATPAKDDKEEGEEDQKDPPVEGDPITVPGCVSTDTFGCMIPSVSEGSRGRWFYLPDLTVRKDVPASQNPYFISVVATDTDGRKAEAEVPIFVSDGTLPLALQDLPHLVSAVATEKNEVQAFFSSSVNPDKIRSDAFTLSFFNDIYTHLPIKDIDIRTDGQVVTLRTNYMNEGDRFTLFADAEQLGLRQIRQTDNQASFTVPTIHERKLFFEIEKVTSVSPNAIEVVFRKPLRFSSLLTDGANFSITAKGSGKVLPVRGAQFKNDHTITLSTGVQVPESVYILRATDLIDYTGKKLRKGTDIKTFSAFSSYGKNPFVITKTVDKEIASLEENVEFTIHISNENNKKALHDVVLLDTFSSDIIQVLEINTSDAFSCGNDESEIQCVIDEIPPGADYTMVGKFKAISPGLATNTISAISEDKTLSVSSANVAVIDPGNPFLIKKTPNKVDMGINEEIEFRISITNRTEGQMFQNVSITDDFPQQLIKLLEVEPLGSFSCQNDVSQIDCLIPSFGPGQTYTFLTRFVAISEGMVTNTVVASTEIKENYANTEDGEVPLGVTTGAASSNVFIQNPFLNADFNDDLQVDFLDFSVFAQQYGSNGKNLPDSDFNKDGKVDFLDFSVFAQQYGLTYETVADRTPRFSESVDLNKKIPEDTDAKDNPTDMNPPEENPEKTTFLDILKPKKEKRTAPIEDEPVMPNTFYPNFQ